jgi:hypothetical protein
VRASVCPFEDVVVWGPTSSFYRPRKGSTGDGFLRKESLGHGKPSVLPWGEATCARWPRGRLPVSYSLWWTVRAMWGPSANIWATLTPCLHNPGLGTTYDISCCTQPAVYALRSSLDRS